MNWTLNWLLSGGIAFALVIVNLIRVSGGKTAGCQALMFCSMSGGVLAVLDRYRQVSSWIKAGDLSAVGDTLPWTAGVLTVAVCILLILNLITVVICMVMNQGHRRRDKRALADAEQRAKSAAEQRDQAEAERASWEAASRAYDETPPDQTEGE